MVKTVLFLLAILLIIALIWVIPALKATRRSRLFNQPFPWHWAAILEGNLPIYKRLPGPLRKRLHGHINVFLAEKQFIGCGGLLLTDEIKLTIAAVACLLLLNERGEYYPKLSSILVYPRRANSDTLTESSWGQLTKSRHSKVELPSSERKTLHSVERKGTIERNRKHRFYF